MTPEPHAPRYMPNTIGVRAIAIGGGLIALAIVVSIVAAFFLVRAGEAPHPAKAPPPIAGATRLEPDPATTIAAYQAQKRRELESYGWVDRARGIVHIPIERAMDLLASGAATAPQRR